MKKLLSVTFWVMVSLMASHSSALEVSQPPDLSESIFKVKSRNMRNRCIQGTAFQLDVSPNRTLVTAAHVFRNDNVTCQIITATSVFPCEVAALDRTRDLALVVVTDGSFTPIPLPLSDTDPRRGDAVYAVGFPEKFNSSECFISSGNILRAALSGGALLLSAPVYVGMSGGPLLNAQGEVIGVVQRTRIAASRQMLITFLP